MSGDCGCGGVCGGAAPSSAAEGGGCGDSSIAAASPSASCGGSCGGECADCTERERVGALNWGRLQANSNLGMSEFWRQATIGDIFNRTTGESLPFPLLPLVSRLGPTSTVGRFEGPSVLPRLAMGVHPWPRNGTWSPDRVGAVNTGFPDTDSTTPGQAWLQSADQDQRGMSHWTEDLWAESVAYEGQQVVGGGAGAQQTAPLGQVPGDSGGAIDSEAPKDPHEGEAGHWVNKYGDPVLSAYGTSTFWLTVDHWQPDYPPPPPEPTKCCCCVKHLYVSYDPNPHAWRDHRDGRSGNAFKVIAELGHMGNSKDICPCTFTWNEWASQDYEFKKDGEKAVPKSGRQWNLFPADRNWDRTYGEKKHLPCEDKTVEFSEDKPGAATPIKDKVWEIWIEVCVQSCDHADCECDPKELCLKIHQRQEETDKNTTKSVMEIERYKTDKVHFGSDSVTAPPGRWKSEIK